MTSELTLNLLDTSVFPVEEHVSDHHVVNIKCINFLDIKSNDRKCPLKTSYNFNKIDEKKWSQFRNKLDHSINSCTLKSISLTTNWSQTFLNKYWDLFQDTIIMTANKVIPIIKSKTQSTSKKPVALSSIYDNIKTLQKLSKV